jgi:hypothetical protein
MGLWYRLFDTGGLLGVPPSQLGSQLFSAWAEVAKSVVAITMANNFTCTMACALLQSGTAAPGAALLIWGGSFAKLLRCNKGEFGWSAK